MIRLVKFLSNAGVDSRRKCEIIIKEGRVKINKELKKNPFIKINPMDLVELDDIPILPLVAKKTFKLNKPFNVITSLKDTHQRKTVLNLVSEKERLYPIGRLDKDTTGILLITNDGELAYQLTHPKFKISKIYLAVSMKKFNLIQIKKIKNGINIGNNEIGNANITSQIKHKEFYKITLKLHHGKKREIRRIFEIFQIELVSLHRVSFGGILVGDLQAGKYKKLSSIELKNLKSLIKK